LLAELNQRGIAISYCGVWRFLDHVGLSLKKPPRQRTGSRRRRQWRRHQNKVAAGQ
jgi:transposase